MMLPVRDESLVTHTRLGNPSTSVWLYLSVEFLIGIAISGFLTALKVIKSLLPKPPRDITGDVVLVAGASSSLGECLAEEFAKGGCIVVCVDKDARSVEKMTRRLREEYPRVEEIGPSHRKQEESRNRSSIGSYVCDLMDRDDLRDTARKVKDEIGGIDVLVTCVGDPGQDIFDTASTTLMSHYWTVLAFLPLMFHRDRAHIVGVTPVVSDQDAYLGSRAAVAGLMESLGQELSNHNRHFTFLSVTPTADSRRLRDKEQEVARDVVEAVRRDQCSLNASWSSRFLYRISCMIYGAITRITQWLHTQGCDYSF